MCGRAIFQCNIENLLFNMNVAEDVTCRKAVEAVEEAKTRMYDDSNQPKFSTFKSEMLTTKPKDIHEYFSKDIKILYEIFDK